MAKGNIYCITREDSLELWFKIILFIIYPFGSFLYSLRNAASSSSFLIYFLFGIVFCWHMNPTSHVLTDDFYWIMQRVVENNFTIDEILSQITSFISFSEDAPKEVYENILIFLSKNFSKNPHLFFVFASIPYLVFMLKSLNKITTDEKFTQCKFSLIILLLFVLPRDIITVQNPRFTTGVWIAVFASISFFTVEKYRWYYYILIFLTPFIHSGFWFYVLIFTIGLFVVRYPRFLIFLLYASVPFSYLSYDLLTSLNLSILPLPPTLINWIERYLSEESYNKYVGNEGAAGFFWVQQGFTIFRNTIYLLIPLYLWKYRDNFKENSVNRLFNFFLYYYAVVNFIQFIPVLGERFYWIVRILSIYLWFKMIYPRHNNILILLLFACSWEIFKRYFYEGTLSKCVPLEIFYTPLPNLIADFWGVTDIVII